MPRSLSRNGRCASGAPGPSRNWPPHLQASDLGVRPAGLAAELAQAREILGARRAAANKFGGSGSRSVIPSSRAPTSPSWRPGRASFSWLTISIVAQRVDHGLGQQASLRVGGHVWRLPLRGVRFVELVPLPSLPALRNVARRGNGTPSSEAACLNAAAAGPMTRRSRTGIGNGTLGVGKFLEHKLIVPDGKQITQFRGACAHHVGQRPGWAVCPSTGLVDRLAS